MNPTEVLGRPIRFGPLTLRNRLAFLPHTVNFGYTDGIPNDEIAAYLGRRAPGFGLTWVALACPDPLGLAEPGQPYCWDDTHIPGLARLCERLRATGTEPGLQFNHAGRQTSPDLIGGQTPVAPSAIPNPTIYRTVPRELTEGEIGGLVEAWARAAGRAARAGFRAITLHFAHGYLVSQFLSPDSNLRQDGYGGSLANRMRFGLEVLAGVRAEVGPEVAIEVKVNGSDLTPTGLPPEDAIEFGRALLRGGADGLQVSGGVYGSDPFNLLLPTDESAFIPFARAMRAEFGELGVITGLGKLRTAEQAASVVADGSCDIAGVVRAAMADPDWALRALGELPGPSRPCLGTLDGCSERLRHFLPASCQVTPDLGRELRAVPPMRPLRLAVVGGGPAGCEAALYAAQRGHTVTLLEARPELGGSLRLAAAAPFGSPFGELASFYAAELARLGVDVRTGAGATRALLEGLGPDHVLVATGARPDIPDLPGLELGLAVDDESVLAGEVPVPAGPVAVLGGDRRAVATALFCALRGAEVTLVDHAGQGIARDASALMRRALRRQLGEHRVGVIEGRVDELTGDGMVVDGTRHPFALAVFSLRLRPARDAVNALPAGIPHTVLGDALEPGSIMTAIARSRDVVDDIGRPG